MTGLCGSFGRDARDVEPLAEGLGWAGHERTSTYTSETLSVAVSAHTETAADLPVTARRGEVSVWLWGSVWGYDETRYVPTDPERSAHVCAELYARYGAEFADKLNGTFVALVYDEPHETLHFVSDRLGSHPLYVAASDGSLVFSTDLQGLAGRLDAPVDDARMAEYLTTGRVSGCATPFEGIDEVPPGTVDTYVRDGPARRIRYWLPRYRPLDRPVSHFVDRFVETLQEVVAEYDRPDKRHGLLLSGGSDSRLLLSARPSNLRAYHMADWMGPEAGAAERAAFTADVPFTLLRRDDQHHRKALAANTRMMNFYGRFDQAHTTGFDERLREECDVLVSGLYADTLFKGGALPKRSADLGPFGDLELPLARPIDSVDEFLRAIDRPLPEYVTVSGSLADLLRPDLRRTDRGIEYRGAVYPSLDELAGCWEFYPLSNDPDLFYYGLTQTMPHWTPFLDDRFVDLSLSMPRKYQLRRNVANAALERFDPGLAEIPHARSGAAASRSFPVQYLSARLASLRRRYLPSAGPPKRHHGHGPWSRIDQLLRSDRFGIETIDENREVIERLPFLSRNGAVRCYRDHMTGSDNHFELYMLLGLLEMPLTANLGGRTADPRPSDVPTDHADDTLVGDS